MAVVVWCPSMSIHIGGRGFFTRWLKIGTSGLGPLPLSAGTIAFDTANGWATGQNPPQLAVTLPSDGSVQLGDWFQVEHSQNSFSTSLFTPWHQLTEADIINSGEGSGFAFSWDTATLPAGSTSFRAYFGRGVDASHITLQSPASNVITDTLNTPQATITLTNGAHLTPLANKSTYIAVASPNYQMVFGTVLGESALVRSIKSVANTKSYAEFRLDGWYTSSQIQFGFDDASVDFTITAAYTGSSSWAGGPSGCAGITFTLPKNGTSLFYAGNNSTAGTLSGFTAFAVNDRFGIYLDLTTPAAPVITVTQIRAGAVIHTASAITLTSKVPSQFWVIVGGENGNGTAADGSSDCMTFLPRTTDWAVTPTAGYTFEA